MVSLSAIDYGFEPSQVKPKTIKLVLAASPLRAKTFWLGIRIISPNGAK